MIVHLFIIYFIGISFLQLFLIRKFCNKTNILSNYDKAILLSKEKNMPGYLMFYSYLSEMIFGLALIIYLVL